MQMKGDTVKRRGDGAPVDGPKAGHQAIHLGDYHRRGEQDGKYQQEYEDPCHIQTYSFVW